MNNRKLLFVLIVLVTFVSSCSTPQTVKRRKYSAPLVPLLVENFGFEEYGSWLKSGPPNYHTYAQIMRDDSLAYTGKWSGYVGIFDKPLQKDVEILHGWTQQLTYLPLGETVQFGGWIKATPGSKPKIAIEVETITPRDGQTLFPTELTVVDTTGEFAFCHGQVFIPMDAKGAVFFAGIFAPGAAWFDNLFAFVSPDSMRVNYTRK